ncbi:VanW family protein [Lutispora thermophila]|uniref:Vancomycin resistance protein YoaR, contains peptidoglycan-binding and VanW domains n=1 Tax=Lutispora thermophila DSM 19022 TaxID=1122184 RepID=A0A1M6H507_9FIRM|nr:VanW family protein [Lutispora thermophila]SHJ17169.1 Vancomycin resistance protein YoaR, contains peptidoglycan-binding and VanW domains [Lutispora thermophila DSM 19022]
MDYREYRLTKAAKITCLEFAICIIGLLLGFFWEINDKNEQWNDLIYPGIKVAGIDLGGKTKLEGNKIIEAEYITPLLEKGLNVIVDGKTYKLDCSRLIKSYDIETGVLKAFETGKALSSINKYKIIKHGISHGYDISYEYDEDYLREFSSIVEMDINREPEDAKISVNFEDKIQVVDDIKGYRLDVEKLEEEVKKGIESGALNEIVIDAPLIETKASITGEDLHVIDAKISSASTNFFSSSVARIKNIELAASAINGIVLMDGEVFSFNERVGERTRERGFQVAPVLEDGSYKLGIGGGICQVSSTLYKAMLDSGLKVIERKAHGLAPSYIGLGLDATVSWGSIDLKMKNDLGYPLLIEAYIKDKNIYIDLFSSSNLKNRTYVIKNDVYQKILPKTEIVSDVDLPLGDVLVVKKGSPGYKVRVIREAYENGQLIGTEVISEDIYKPVNQIVKRGIKNNM